jgi:hypothetical protein
MICEVCKTPMTIRELFTSIYYECARCPGDTGNAAASIAGVGVDLDNPLSSGPPSLGDLEFTDWADCYSCKNVGCSGCSDFTWSVH